MVFMNTKAIVGVIVAVLVLAGGVYYMWSQNSNGNGMPNMSPEEMSSMGMPGSGSSSMLAEKNAVIISSQLPGTSITGTAVLEAPGYLTIHENSAGQAGAVLGSSMLLQAGENSNVKVTLSRPMKDGEVLYAMLHADDGDGVFGSGDTLVESSLGGPIMGTFEVSSSANPDVQVSY